MPKVKSPPINIPGTFAAVAVDGKGRWGASIQTGGSLVAERDAIRRCGGGACHVVMMGAGRCVAFAQSFSGGYWIGFARGDNRAVVQQIAFKGCTDRAPRGSCRLEHINCLWGVCERREIVGPGVVVFWFTGSLSRTHLVDGLDSPEERNALAGLQTVPGIDRFGVAMVLVEIGTNMVLFSGPDRLASCAGMCPQKH